MSRRKILVQLDTDPHASTFDAVVAVDAGVDSLLQYAGIEPSAVQPLVHGAMFTRGGDDLRRTAIFIGGGDVAAGEALMAAVRSSFFGPVRVSVLLDSNGCNTTAAAAVLSAARHVDLGGETALVLGGTGPVGRRVARLVARAGGRVRLASRSGDRAARAAEEVRASLEGGEIDPVAVAGGGDAAAALRDCSLCFACGAAGTQLLDESAWRSATSLRVAVDLNAVPPSGIEGIEVTDKARGEGDVLLYGAIGVGGLKMKIHRAAIESLFEANDRLLDAEEVFAIGERLERERRA